METENFTEKLRKAFPATTIYKDQKFIATFKAANIPSFLRDWILKRKANAQGRISNADELREYVDTIIPRKDDRLTIINEARSKGETRKFLANVHVAFDVAKNRITYEIPELGIVAKETIIEDYVWTRIQENLLRTAGGWGMVQLSYLPPDSIGNKNGLLSLLDFKNFCPYKIDLDAFRYARKAFTIEEWLDVLLGAIDYNPAGYENEIQKHTMLTRLLPFIEPRVNLVELAPKGTGKSYLFGNVGKYGWLVSGGTLSRAKMFHDISKRQDGLVACHEFVALDEVQSIKFPDPSEMQGALKAYMEKGEASFGNVTVKGEAGIILLGNIPQDDMVETKDMFRSLPEVFHESALIDRFHGFIKGRNIPRMTENLKINDWALNSEYFSEIMHLLRSQSESMRYRAIVEALIEYPKNADTRDTQAVLRICTAYVKLFFPNVLTPQEMNVKEFVHYCLRPAIEMRKVIRNQLQIIDPKEYGSKNMATYQVREEFLKEDE